MLSRTRLIVAMDMTDEKEALAMAARLKDSVDAYKVNYPLALSCCMEMVTKLSSFGSVICDFKVADIPNTNRLIVEQVVKRGAQGVIVHGFAGSDSVKACVDAAKGKDVYVVAEMSHPGGLEFTRDASDKVALMAAKVGASGLIVPATRPERVAHFRKLAPSLRILATGVGAQGGSARDAIRAGADYVIVGRRIYEAEDPVASAKKIIEEMKI